MLDGDGGARKGGAAIGRFVAKKMRGEKKDIDESVYIAFTRGGKGNSAPVFGRKD